MGRLVLLSDALNRLTSALGISDTDLAAILGVQLRTIDRWRAESAFPQNESRQRLDQLDTLAGRLAEAFKSPSGAQQWLHSPSGYFGGLMPIDALLRGRIDLVDAALEAMDSGVFV